MRLTLLLTACASALAVLGIALAGAAPEQTDELDMKQIFRCAAREEAGIAVCDQARDLILTHCTACHTFVPIVLQQFDQKSLDGLLARHRPRVPQLSDKELATIKAYLGQNFNSRQPPPKLPEELMRSWLPY